MTEPLGKGSDGKDVFLRDIWPSAERDRRHDRRLRSLPRPTRTNTPRPRRARRNGKRSPAATRRAVPVGRREHVRAGAAVLRRHADDARADRGDFRSPRAGLAGRFGDDRPHQPGRLDQGRFARRPVPAAARRQAARFQQLRQPPRQRPRDDPGHVRQHPPQELALPGHRRGRHQISADRQADVDLRRGDEIQGGRRLRSSFWPARNTAPVRRATGRPREPICSASAP